MSHIVIAALYQFKHLPEPTAFQRALQEVCAQNHIKGTLIVAEEGINGTVAGTREAIDHLKSFLAGHFEALEYKESYTEALPFKRMKVHLKREIVTLGVPGIHPEKEKGTYVSPEEWNDLISDPEVMLIDTRNTYEVGIGTFRGAVNPHTRSFTEFPEFVKAIKNKNQKIAMYCTGGVRCEKASAYMLSQGFDTVYHLKGGILKYLETIPQPESLWDGDCFVFDERVALGQGLAPGQYESCHGCRRPISEEDKASPLYERGVSCPKCYDSLTLEKKESARERQRQEDLAAKRGQTHIGARMAPSKT